MSIYKFGRFVCYIIVNLLFRIKVIGKENIPKNGPVIICSNHISNFDPPLVGATNKRPISFMGKAELFEKPIMGKLMRKVRVFPVKRGLSDRNALKTGLKILKDEQVIGLFPEGRRSKTGEIGKGLAGAGFFALRSDAVIIPCAIIGEYKLFKRVYVVYGRPVEMASLKKDKVSPQQATDTIMEAIRSLKKQYS